MGLTTYHCLPLQIQNAFATHAMVGEATGYNRRPMFSKESGHVLCHGCISSTFVLHLPTENGDRPGSISPLQLIGSWAEGRSSWLNSDDPLQHGLNVDHDDPQASRRFIFLGGASAIMSGSHKVGDLFFACFAHIIGKFEWRKINLCRMHLISFSM